MRANQYSAPNGVPALLNGLKGYYQRAAGWDLDPQKNILVTSSATEGLYAAAMAFLSAGDEVIVFEPIFPWYSTNIRCAASEGLRLF